MMPFYTDRPTHLKNQARTEHETHVEKLIKIGGCPTQWSFFHEIGDQSPGFLTPFGRKTSIDMYFQQAVIATMMMPLLKLQDTILIACILPMNLANVARSLAAGDIENSLHSLLNVGRNISDITISLASFGLQLIKEVTALITRTLATLFSCLLIPFGRIDAVVVVDAVVKPTLPRRYSDILSEEGSDCSNSSI